MTTPRVEWPDPEMWLCAHIRAELGEPATLVTNELSQPMSSERIVVVRYDGGSQESIVTEESQYGITVYGARSDRPQAVMDCARRVRSIVGSCPGIEGPFAACRRTSGPVRVPNNSRPERYLTATLVTVATAAST